MAELSKQALKVENNTSFPDNNNGAITPSDLRAFNVDMIDSLVSQPTYTADSASWNADIAALEAFTASQQPSFTALNQFTASQLTINSGVNTFTQSATGRLNNLEAYTASFTTSVGIYDEGTFVQNVNQIDFNGNGITASYVSGKASVTVDFSNLNSATQSLQAQLATIGGQSGSWITESETGSFVSSAITASSLITASFNNGTRNLTFTKGDNTTFNVNIPDVSGSIVATGSLLVTASAVDNVITFTKGDGSTFPVTVTVSGSQGSIPQGTVSGSSQIIQLGFLQTSSFNSYTSSNNQRVSSLESNSASVNISINALNTFTASQSTASIVTSITNLNNFTSSANSRLTNIETFSASALVSITNLNAATASFVTESETGSFFVSASTNNTNVISFVQGNGNIFGLTIATGSLASLNLFTQSADVRLNNLETTSASVNAFTQSANQRLTAIESVSGSWITESETGSFARYNVSNPWSADQTFTNIFATSASFQYVQTVFETASVIYSSGSNQFGDAVNDIQTLIGQTKVSGSLGVTGSFYNNGLIYPTTDGIFPGQVLQTNAAGALSFGNVAAVFENIRNGELTTITKGTPLYVSGAQGDTPIVYRADATNPAKMPVTFVAMENIASNATGRGITLGLITGIDMTGYPAGTQLWVDGLGLLTNVRPTGSADIVQPIGIVTKTGNGGQLNILNPGPILLPNIQTGYVWVGDATNYPVAVATSSFVSSGLTGSFATTGSNIFIGNQTITGSVTISSSAATDLSIIGAAQVTSNNGLQINSIQPNTFNINTTQDPNVNAEAYMFGSTASVSSIYVGVFDDPNFNTDVELKLSAGSNGLSFNDWDNGSTFSYIPFMTIEPNLGNNPAPVFTRGLVVTGSANIQNLNASGSVVISGSTNLRGNLTQSTGSITAFGNVRTTNGLFSSSINGGLEISGLGYVGSGSAGAYFIGTTTQDLKIQNWYSSSVDGKNIVIENYSPTGSNPIFGKVALRARGVGGAVTVENTSQFRVECSTTISGSLIASGSNTFIGNQTITGSVIISSSATYDLEITGAARVTSQNGLQTNTIGPNTFNIETTRDASVPAENFIFASTASAAAVYVGVYDSPNFNTDVELKLKADSTGLSFNDWDNGSTFAYVPWLEIEPNTGNNPAPQFKRSISVTGSVSITEIINLKAQNPLPTGNIGDLAVSGSHLYFYNGAWTQLD